MNRRAFLKTAALGGAAAFLAQRVNAAQRPNFLFLYSDDHRWNAMGCAGDPVIQTPELDRLAAEGVLFENAFVTTSICCVSRASVLTGQYARRHGVHDFFKPLSEETLDGSVSSVLREHGYYTGFIGKWGVGDSVAKTNLGARTFDYWAGGPKQTNFWHEADCPYVLNDGIHNPTDNVCTCPPDARGVKGVDIRVGKANIKNPVHLETEIVPAKADQFLATRDKAKPFCLNVFLKAPHGPWSDWDPATEHIYDGQILPAPKAANPAYADDRPEFLKKSLAGGTGQRWATDPQILQRQMRDYYRLITTMDMGIGKIRASLEKHGVADNTVILYISDNGHFLGDHGFAGKWLMHEESIRVPAIAYDPRAPKRRRGRRCEGMVLNIDMGPTMIDLAGIPAPAHMQGMSIAPLFQNSKAKWRDEWFYEHLYEHNGAIEPSVGVRGTRWKYTRYYKQDPVYETLYDLKHDPEELTDLARDPAFAEKLAELRTRCDAYEKNLV